MARYAIGDIQGCFDEFQRLLAKIDFAPGRDTLWITGDLVNRGPKSLETLRFVMQHEDCMQTVLGNHDLHLLAVAFGSARLKRNDTLQDILNATDNKFLLDWLRQQPLLLEEDGWLLVHAGVWPEWDAETALDLAEEVEDALQGARHREFFSQMYGNKPRRFNDELRGMERLRFITNASTRMRALESNNDLEFDYKGTLKDMPAPLHAWFDSPEPAWAGHRIVFGHWSTLGLVQTPHVVGLDTGALWGGQLSALNLDTGALTQVQGYAGGKKLLETGA